MRMAYSMAVLLAATAAARASEDVPRKKHGTEIPWERSIEAAAKAAKEDGRLVLVLHISGEFGDPDKT